MISFLKRNVYLWVLLAILGVSFAARAINLDYNSAFNDEAIYIVVGRLGIFQGDWWTYNAAAWMAGQPYIYPPISALAYMTHGIEGARLLNVIFGVIFVEVIFALTFLLARGTRSVRLLAGLVAAAVVGLAPVALYVSRLATYDMLSFLFLGLSLVTLIQAQKPSANWGKFYAASAITLGLAFFTKIIIGAYIPFIIGYSYLQARRAGEHQLHFWLIYFCLPILGLMAIYAVGNASAVLTYAQSQIGRDYSSYTRILTTYWENSRTIWLLWVVGAAGLLIKKQWRLLLTLTAASLLILGIHLATHRWPTLDKHVLLSVLFIFPVIGIGLANLVSVFRQRSWQAASLAGIVLLFLSFWGVSYHQAQAYNHMWTNSNDMLAYLRTNTKPDTKVLAEVGASAILVNYDQDFPPNTTTFDWFEYQHKTGVDAYQAALRDGYFDLIELDGGDSTDEDVHNHMHTLIRKNLGDNYEVGYKTKDFTVYRRTF